MRNKIYAIVEGQGEANKPSSGELPAIIVLIKRLLYDELACWSLFPVEKSTHSVCLMVNFSSLVN